MRISFVFLALCVSSIFAAEWQILSENVLSVALGCSASDADNIYVSGGDNTGLAAILKSEDGGNSFTSLPHDPQILYLDVSIAKDSSFGVAAGIGLLGLNTGASITVDGKSFSPLPSSPFFLQSQSCSAVDEKTFFIVATYQQSVFDESHNGLVASFDGGKTVSYIDWKLDTYTRYGSFPSNSTWYISGGTFPTDAQEKKEKKEEKKENSLFSGKSEFYLNSWVSLGLNEQGERIVKIRRPSREKNGYQGTIGKTVDGGKTFKAVFNSTGLFYFNGIDCTDENTCWAVAEGLLGAYIFHTSDGGFNWIQQSFIPDGGLFDVQMISSLEGWAVGATIGMGDFSSLFLKTNDGGKSWISFPSVFGMWPNSLAVVDSEKAFATAFGLNGLGSILVYQ